MFAYDFMINAFAASAVVAVLSALVGYFLVLRGQSFAGHALSHVGFTGATGAILIGVAPLWGLLAATVCAGLGMALLGERLSGRDVAIGMVLAVSLGLGLLFLHFFTAYATQATALLFGNVLGVDRRILVTLAVLSLACIVALLLMGRPLLFASLQPELAEARGVDLRLVSVAFLVLVAVATAECAQIVGVLLVFTLMVGPAASAQLVTRSPAAGLPLGVLLALCEACLGVAGSWWTDWPVSFWISALSGLVYLSALAVAALGRPQKLA